MRNIGYMPGKTEKMLKKVKTRAKQVDEEHDFLQAWAKLPRSHTSIADERKTVTLFNQFYDRNHKEINPAQDLPASQVMIRQKIEQEEQMRRRRGRPNRDRLEC